MKRTLLLMSLFACVVLMMLDGQAQTIITASDDAYVRGGQYVSSNFDTATGGNGLRIRASRTPDNWRKVYIKFDLSSYTDVLGQATLSIWLDRAVGTGYNVLTNPFADTTRFYTVDDDNWTESAITWNSAPAAGDYLFTEAFFHRTSAMPDTMYTWDVTSYVRREYAGDKVVTFLLIDSDTATHGASIAIDTAHGTDLRMYSLETPFYEPALVISPIAQPTVHVTSPNGGENWSAGSTHDITWTSEIVQTVSIELSTDAGSSWTTLVPGLAASAGTYAWIVPDDASAHCKVRIRDSSNAAVNDVTDGWFTITGLNVPVAATDSASNITASSATLFGSVEPKLSQATAHFDWGVSAAYGYRTSDVNVLNTSLPIMVSADIGALLPSTTYHFRMVATNDDGTTYGPDRTFTTNGICTGNCIIASDDAFVRGGVYSSTNFNIFTSAGDALRIRANVADSNKRMVYVKFDMSAYQGTIENARLAMWVDRALNARTSNPDTAILCKLADDSWSESAITWDTAPVAGEQLLVQPIRHRLSTDPDTLYQWDVTPYVQAEYSGDKVVGFVLMDPDTTHGTDLRMFSHETAGFEPTLIIQGTVGVNEEPGSLPGAFALGRNYPNPFNPSTNLSFSIGKAQFTTLRVYDVLGREVATLVQEVRQPGTYTIHFDGSRLPSGVYYYRLTSGAYTETKAMMLVK